MDIVVKGRNVEVPEHYRSHVSEKLARLARYDRKVIRYEVELFHEPNRRQAKSCQRVEITGLGKGPAIRAEAASGDFYAALDSAVNKIERRLRKKHDQRKVHYGRRALESVAEATAVGVSAGGSSTSAGASRNGAAVGTAVLESPSVETAPQVNGFAQRNTVGRNIARAEDIELPQQRWEDADDGYQPGRIVREKTHPSEPMSLDQALYQMELVGHDFYLFHDADTDKASVVYRRRGFDYGVVRLS